MPVFTDLLTEDFKTSGCVRVLVLYIHMLHMHSPICIHANIPVYINLTQQTRKGNSLFSAVSNPLTFQIPLTGRTQS